MAIDFKVEQHSARNVFVIEVWVDGQFRATIAPTEKGGGIRVISSYFSAIEYQPGDPDGTPRFPAALDFTFAEKPTLPIKLQKS